MSLSPAQVAQINGLSVATMPAGDARVGIDSMAVQNMSPYVAAALKTQATYCDAASVAQKMSLPRFTWLGVPITNVAFGATAGIPVATPGIFVGDQLRFDQAATADSIVVNSININTNNQILQGPVPGSVFSTLGLSSMLDMDMAKPGQPITLSVTNAIGPGAVNVYGAFGGFTVTGC